MSDLVLFALGVFTGFLISTQIFAWLHKKDYDSGYKDGIDWAKSYWQPLVEHYKQRSIREWLR